MIRNILLRNSLIAKEEPSGVKAFKYARALPLIVEKPLKVHEFIYVIFCHHLGRLN